MSVSGKPFSKVFDLAPLAFWGDAPPAAAYGFWSQHNFEFPARHDGAIFKGWVPWPGRLVVATAEWSEEVRLPSSYSSVVIWLYPPYRVLTSDA